MIESLAFVDGLLDAATYHLVVAICRSVPEAVPILMASRRWLPPTPVLALSVDPSIESAISLLRAGADNWLPINSHPSLTRAAIAAALRRNGLGLGTNFSIDRDAHMLTIGNRRVRLRKATFRVCEYLIQHSERWISEHELRHEALGLGPQRSESLVRVHVRHIRIALGEYGSCLQSRRLVGYRFVAPS